MHSIGRLLRKVGLAPGRAVAFWTSRPLLLFATTGVVVAVLAFGTVRALSWMETASFCGRCHTMQPEVTAHLRSPHETVECAECHVGEGLTGLVKSKWDGMQQMLKLVTGRYARPIAPAAHKMPPASETCARCHDPAQQRGDLLLTRSYFDEDRENSERRVALVVRLSDDPERQTTGIHWHVLSEVEFLSRDEEGRVIDWIGVKNPDGSREEFISQAVVEISEQAGQQAAELRRTGHVRRMTCYDCHNRVGHAFSTPDRAIDAALADGRIDRELPFIKKRGLEVLSMKHESLAAADRTISRLGDYYHRTYPYLYLEKPESVRRSLEALARIYRQTASPEMRAFFETYPSFLGHTDTAGCFRCHDGGHYKIVDGRLSDEAIPSRCSLCHTFPSVGERAPNVMLGPPPRSHGRSLWVFEHKDEASSLDPAQTECSACHSQTYCSNCHSTGAMNITHDNMLYDHADVIRETGEQACGYCHQEPFCERCHYPEEIEW